MCDQMKMKDNVTIGMVTNETSGVSDEFLYKRKILKKLLDYDNTETLSKPVQHVNRWQFWYVGGRSYNGEYWYDCDDLTVE